MRFEFNNETPPAQNHLLATHSMSDMLTLDLACHNIVYAGLRNSEITSGDFRDHIKRSRTIATLKHKAVVKVKRLSDSTVPFGLLVSGMDDKVWMSVSGRNGADGHSSSSLIFDLPNNH
jgi:hypothetical protein